MGKMKKVIGMILVICLTLTMIPMIQAEKYEAAEKVGSELLDVLGVTYEELLAGNFVDMGESYSCMIWLYDVDVEEAVEAGIDAAERTRENYSVWRFYDYPYTTYDEKGLTYVDVELSEEESNEYVQTYIEAEREVASELYAANNNSFVADYKGIDLGYTQGAGFNVYGPGYDRGVRIFNVSENGSYETRTLTFGELCGKKVKNLPKFVLYTYAPTSVSQVVTTVKEAAVVAAAVAGVVGLVKAVKKKK